MKKAISLLLSLVIAFSVIVPAFNGLDFATTIKAEAATSKASDAYATVFATSDFQDGRSGNLVEANFKAAMNNALANGSDEPDGFILGGDYESSYADKHSTPDAYHRVEDIITDVFPYYNKKNIIAIQGNHDVNDTSVLDDTGLYEFEHYLVYVIANEDYPAGTSTTSKAKTEDTTDKLVETFDKLMAEGETRPIFIATHIPLHHNSRNPNANNKDENGNVVSMGYNETLYSRILFESINAYATVFDIVFMYGHNHSGAYDDYIGGSVNYIAKGEKIRIPDYTVTPSETSYKDETLNFTYMNYGYIGYSNNKNDATLTMSAFEICPDRIELTRYSAEGVHSEHTIVRSLKTNEASVNIATYGSGAKGSATGALATATGFTDPVYTWSTTDNEITTITSNGRLAQISYNKTGTATVTVTATERNDPSKTATSSEPFTVYEDAVVKGATIRVATQDVTGKTLEYYNTTFGKELALIGSYTGFSANGTTSWGSSDRSVATVNNGMVTFVGSGTTFITYTATEPGGSSYTAQVKLVISNAPKVEYVYEEVPINSLSDGKKIVIATTRDGNNYIHNAELGDNGQGVTINGTKASFAGTSPDRTVTVPDESYVWTLIATDTAGAYYLRNESTGMYLSAVDAQLENYPGRANFVLSAEKPSVADGGWRVDSTGNIWNGTYYWYVRGSGVVNLINSQKTNYVVVFEQKAADPSVSIDFRGDVVDGTTQTVHSVTDVLQIPAYGHYTNIEQLGEQTWTSSETSVVTVDENGILSFHAKEGTSVITYTVEDTKSGETYSTSFTVEAKLGSEYTRTFKYTKKIEPGKKYVILNQTEIGTGMMLTSYVVSNMRLLAENVEVQLNSANESFVNVEADNLYPVWITESAGDGTYYLKNEYDGSYFYAVCDGTADEYGGLNGEAYISDSYAENTERYKWTYTGSNLYNSASYTLESTGETVDKTYLRLRSACFPGIGTEKDRNVYLFEEVEAEPNGIITLRYNTLGATYVADGICPDQTDTFGHKAENFPDNNEVDFSWSIAENDEDLASIDPETGVVTYTGKAGNLTLTLTSTSRVYDADGKKPVDTTTVEVIINGGEIDPPEVPDDPDAPVYTENAFYKTTELVPGKKYVLHTSYSGNESFTNIAIGNKNENDTYVRLRLYNVSAPATDDYGEYVTTTDTNIVWICEESGTDGYYKLKNVATGEYLFTSESESTSAKHQAGVTVSSAHPEASSVGTAANDTLLIKYDSSNGMLFSKQVVDSGAAYGIGNVAIKSDNSFCYIRPTTPSSSGSPASFITLYAEPDQSSGGETESNYYYLTDQFVDGEKYILRGIRTAQSAETDDISLAISNSQNGTKLEGVQVTPINGIIENTDKSIVWIAEAGSTSGTFYLRNAETGEYLALAESDSSLNVTDSKTEFAADEYEFSYSTKYGVEGYKGLTASGAWIRYSGGFYESSSCGYFELYAQGETPEGGGTITTEKNLYYLTETFEVGKKYLISNSNTAGDTAAHVMSNQYYSANKILKAVATEIKSNSTGTYISNPGSDVLIVEAVASDVPNYVKLRTEDGKYLVVVYYDADGNKLDSGDRKVLLANEGEYLADQYLFRAHYSTSNEFNVLMTNEGGALIYSASSSGGTNRWSASGTAKAIYIYGLDENTIPEPVETRVQIRTMDYFGSINISSVTQYRYDIDNGDTEQLYRYLENVEEGYTYTWSSSDTSIATIDASTGLITYTGTSGNVTFTLTVTGVDANGDAVNKIVSTPFKVSSEPYKLSDNDYPSYPDEGSIRVSKTASNTAGGTTFQKSGVTEIELGVTGVPVTQAVDVVVVLDHSDSMNGNDQLLNAINDTRNFALQLFNENENNRIAIVTFDQFRYHYESIGSTELKYSETGNEDRIVTGDGTLEGAFVKADQIDNLVSDIESLAVNAYGGTNYDSGLNYAYRILEKAKEDPNANKNQVVVFMSDGAPTKFNGLKLDNTNSGSIGEAWLIGDETHSELAPYLENPSAYPAASLFNTDGENWYAEAIKTPEGQTVEGLPNHSLYSGYETGLGAKIYTIGYNSGAQAAQLLARIASAPTYYYSANSNLQDAYNSILEQILNAADNAVVTDKMGDHFDVQFASSFQFGSGNSATTVTLSPAPKFEVGYWTLDNVGNRVKYTVIETITFTTNSNGVLTAAKSSVAGDCYDVASSTIKGRYVSYNLNTETFTWNIGTINKTEITLKYFACLEGAANGEREAGTFDTNEYATLSYTNFRGTENCSKVFPVPTLAWEQAAVSYDFYLVNEAGQPVNLSGDVVPFSERVTIGLEQTKQLLLNSSTTLTSYSLIAENELPEGYELYNSEAVYTIVVSSSSTGSTASISDSTLTTYYRDGSYAVNVNGTVPNVSDYANTAVSFAVKVSQGVIPDSIVIDYGLPVKINVLGNDYVVDGGVITGVAKSVSGSASFNSKGNASSVLVSGGTTDVAMAYGKVSVVEDANVYGQYYIVYTPATTNMPAEDVFYYEYMIGNTYYCAKVTVIPAANIYYEETFMTFVDGDDGYEWEDVGTAITGRFQAEDRPGTFSFSDFDANNAYGEDEAYSDSYTYSLGSAKKTTVDAAALGKEATAEFTFSGTGFDLFSVTSNETGAVQVTIYQTGTKTIYKNFLVNTYYGYKLQDGVPLPDLDSTAGLYQVPVISRRDLAYGTYDVVIKPIYSSAFDPNYDSSKDETQNDYSIYVDSVRIFNPAGTTVNDTIADAYYKDGEYAPAFKEIRDTLLSAEEFYDEVITNLELGFSGSIFLDGNASNGIGESALATYKTQGPKNEIYLGKGQAIAFTVSSQDREALASLQLGMKVVSGGDTATVTIMNTSEKYPNSITLSGAHESFKAINSAIIWDNNQINYEDMTENTYSSLYPIVIANTSEEDTVISLTSFKWAHTTKPESEAAAATVDFMVDDTTPMAATMALRNAMGASEEAESNGTYNEEEITINWSDDTFVEGKEATLNVKTPAEVVRVTVGGIDITECSLDENGNKIWTYSFVVQQAGENAYEVKFYDYNGAASEPVMTETIYVEDAADDPAADEPSKFVQVLTDIFSKVLSFLKTIIEFFWRLF